jgi:histidinol dehydrogenase
MRFLEIVDDNSYREVVERLSAVDFAGESGQSRDRWESVRTILEDVRRRGDAAVAEYTKKFDGVDLHPSQFELSKEDMAQALAYVDPGLVATLERAHANIRAFHSKHLRQSWEDVADDGMIVGQRITAIPRAGVYVPGAKAFYPSSVLMNIVPAQVAGVKEIVMVSPPSHQGNIHPVVLAAAKIAGATRVFRIGGPQAIAALAFGTEHVPAVLKITGPGNAYVAMAKRLVSSICAIDMEAGPSEVVVIADEKAKAKFVAAELLAQAEHDEDARSILITTSKELVGQVREEVSQQVEVLPRRDIIKKSLERNGLIVLARDMDEASALTDIAAPEHLSIQTEFPRKVFDKISHAGAVMLGGMTPVATGDYYAGPNHILPTGRRARFASPLTAEDFRKVTSIIAYTHERLVRDSEDIRRLAEAEQLSAHARAVEIRK